MAGFRKHIVSGVIAGSFIAAGLQYLGLNLQHYNPGVIDLVKIILSAGAGGVLADVDQRFSVASSVLLVLIYTGLSAVYIRFFFTTLYSPGSEPIEFVLIWLASFAVIYALTRGIFQMFQSIFTHGEEWHSVLYVTLLLVLSLVIFFVQNQLNPERARYNLFGYIISFLAAYLVHLGIDTWR